MAAPIAMQSVAGLFSTLCAVPNGILRKDKRFYALGVRLVVVNVATGAVAIMLALAGAGCYALVAKFAIENALTFFWNMALSGLRIRRVLVLRPLRAIWGFSAYQAAHGFVNYFSRNMDNLLVGLFFGSAALGLYDKAYKLSIYPVGAFNAVISSVLHPFLADYQGDPAEIYQRFLRLAKALFSVGILISACCVAAPSEVLVVVFGDQWIGAGPMFMALSASTMFQIVTSMTGPVFQSLGKTREAFLSAVANTSITLAAILGGIASGSIIVLACLVSLAYILNPIATFYYLIVRAFNLPSTCFVREMAPQLAVAFAMLVVAFAAHVLVDGFSLPFWPVAPLVVKLCICSACYSALLVVTGQWRHVRVFFGSV